MNRDMLMAGLEHYSCSLPSHEPSRTSFVYTEDIGPDHPQNLSGRNCGDKLQHSLMWHDVAAAALARIEALERAEWFVKLPENEQWRFLQHEAKAAEAAQRKADELFKRNDIQAAEIRRLQAELDAVMGASRV